MCCAPRSAIVSGHQCWCCLRRSREDLDALVILYTTGGGGSIMLMRIIINVINGHSVSDRVCNQHQETKIWITMVSGTMPMGFDTLFGALHCL